MNVCVNVGKGLGIDKKCYVNVCMCVLLSEIVNTLSAQVSKKDKYHQVHLI